MKVANTWVSVFDDAGVRRCATAQRSELVTDAKLARWVREALEDATRLTAMTGRPHRVEVAYR